MGTILITGNAEVWHLFVYTTIAGTAWSLNLPVRQSVVSRLVPPNDLMNAVALTAAGFNITGIVGPTLAGFLLGALGPGENFYLQAFMYGTVALLVVQLRPLPPRSTIHVSVRRNLADGLSHVWRDRPLRVQMTLSLVPFIVIFPYIALLPIFADDIFGRGATGFGIMMTAVGFGSVIGTLTIASLSGIQRKGPFLVTAVGAIGCFLMLYALSPNYYLSLVLLSIVGALVMVFITTNNTLLQMAVPEELRGRVMGLYMLNQGLVPLGSLFAGALASVTNAQTAVFTLGAIATVLAVAFALRAPSLHRV
jgi:MFS family permease